MYFIMDTYYLQNSHLGISVRGYPDSPIVPLFWSSNFNSWSQNGTTTYGMVPTLHNIRYQNKRIFKLHIDLVKKGYVTKLSHQSKHLIGFACV